MKFSIKGMALAMGVVWALSMFVTGITAHYGFGGHVVEVMASIYHGYAPGPVGAFIGAVWGFVDGLIGGALFAYFYNRFSA